MNDDKAPEIIVLILLFLTFLFGVLVNWIIVTEDYVRIPKQEWKCKSAIIVNDDPSKTECTLYKRNEK
jgi:hypothetical protein